MYFSSLVSAYVVCFWFKCSYFTLYVNIFVHMKLLRDQLQFALVRSLKRLQNTLVHKQWYPKQAERDVAPWQECSLMVRWVIGSILHGVDPLSVPRLVYQRLWYVLSCLWDGAYKSTLLLIRKSSLCGSSGFPFSLSEWSLTINKVC